MEAKIIVDRDYKIGKVEKNLFGSFIEHMGRAVYGGIYQKDHVTADENGFRGDVSKCVSELSVPIIRYPGGNFLSGYDWKNGIGDITARRPRLDLAWGQIEPNLVGMNEFFKWAEAVGSEVMMSVNMGTGTPQDAAEVVEYCNHGGGGYFGDLRKAHGRKEPYAVKNWCIGNEMDGDWQICMLTADEYGRKATETAKMMRMVDPSLKLTVCGSSSSVLPTFPSWDRTVLEHTYQHVDYLSLHRYYEYPQRDRSKITDFLCSYVDFNALIKTAIATCDYVKAAKRGKKDIMISMDEWNVWHTSDAAPLDVDTWTVGPKRVENHYDMADAIVFSQMMISLINNCDRIKIACLAQLVNVIAPIITEGGKNGRVLKQTIYYPYLAGILHAKGVALGVVTSSHKMHSDIYGDADTIYTAATLDEENKKLTVFAVNADLEQNVSLTVDCRSFDGLKLVDVQTVSAANKDVKNTFDRPNEVTLKKQAFKRQQGVSFEVELSKFSFNVLVFELV